MAKVLCIGASMALPREGVSYEDTWYYMLTKKWGEIHDFIHYFTRSLLMPQIEAQYCSYYKYYNPEIVIWQSGITDCAPRIINERSYIWSAIIHVVNKLGLTKIFWKVIKLFFKRNPKCVNTSYKSFCSSAERIVDALVKQGTKHIIFIKIGKIGSKYQKRSPKWVDNIKLYNTCYEKLKVKYPDIITLIDPLGGGMDDLYIDSMHTNRKGSELVFNMINAILERYETK